MLVAITVRTGGNIYIPGSIQAAFDDFSFDMAQLIIGLTVAGCILAIICGILWELLKPKLKEYNFMGKILYDVILKALKVSGGLIVVYLFILDILERASSNVVNDKTIPMIALSIFGILVLTIIGNMAFVALSYYWKKVKYSSKKARQ
jgi:hypothetical protein